MDLSKSFCDWDDEEITMAVTTFTNWHNSRYYSNAVCQFKKADLTEWVQSLLPDLKNGNLILRYTNHLVLTWLKMRLIRSEGGEFIAMVGMVVDDEYWVICGKKVDKLGLLTVLKQERGTTPFTFEHHKAVRSDTFEGALRIAGFTIEDVASHVSARDMPRRRRGAAMTEEEREERRDRDVQ